MVVGSFTWLPDVANWCWGLAERVWAVIQPLVIPVLAGIALVFAVWLIRWLRLLWRGRTPRVQISAFEWAGHGAGAGNAGWVTTLFRKHLAELRLDALDPLPERSPGAPLVAIVEGVGQSVGHGLDLGAAVGRLFRAVWADCNYEVWGSLRPGDDGGCSISVQVVNRARGNQTMLNEAFEESDWEQGARQASMAVAGALYPSISKRRRGPWSEWRKNVPRDLIDAHERAIEHENGNRLEQAMGAYHEALSKDPLNPHIRLSIAKLQERLALYLDAWVTYRAIVDESDRNCWSGPSRPVRLIALYRLAILLGNGRVARQWMKRSLASSGPFNRRDEERGGHRREIRIVLRSDPMFKQHLRHPDRRIAHGRAIALLGATLRQSRLDTVEAQWLMTYRFAPPYSQETAAEANHRAKKINEVLEVLALRRLEELETWLRFRPPWRLWRLLELRSWWRHRPPLRRLWRRSELSPTAVHVSKRLARIRIAASEKRRFSLLPGTEPGAAGLDRVEKACRSLTGAWPFPRRGLWRLPLRILRPRVRWANLRSDAWQLHYNAACSVAVTLLDQPSSTERESKQAVKWNQPLLKQGTPKFVSAAIAELEQFAHRAGSSIVAANADWIAFDDPDLAGLAKQPEFQLWSSHHLPFTLPEERPHRNIDVNRYAARLIEHGARKIAQVWRERAEETDPPVEAPARWWQEEKEVWARLWQTCREFRSWDQRLEMLTLVEAWRKTNSRSESTAIDLGHEERRQAVGAEDVPKEVFEALAKVICAGDRAHEPGEDELLGWAQSRADQWKGAQEGRPPGLRLVPMRARCANCRKEALRAARVWTRLAEVLDDELNRGDLRRDEPDATKRLACVHSAAFS